MAKQSLGPLTLSGRSTVQPKENVYLSTTGNEGEKFSRHWRDAPHVFYSFIVEDIVLVGRAIFETSLVDVRSVGSFAIPSFKLTTASGPGRAVRKRCHNHTKEKTVEGRSNQFSEAECLFPEGGRRALLVL